MTRFTALGLAAFLVALGATGGDRSEAAASPPTPANELRLPLLATTSLDTLDPVQSVELVQYNIDSQIFEGLVRVDKDGKIVPGLASHWDVSPDFRRYRFTLRDARFADDACFPNGKGRLVEADDVLFSLRRGLDPRAGSKGSWALSRSVRGARMFSEGKATEVAGLRKLDRRTIEIELDEGDRYFLGALTFASTYVVPPEAVQRYGAQFGSHPVGSGPFRLESWQKGQAVVLAKNPSYGKGAGPQPNPAWIERVRFVFFRSEAQVAAAFDRGELDVRDVYGADLARIGLRSPTAELQRLFPAARVIRPGWVVKVHLLAPSIGPEYAFGASAESRRALSQLFPRAELEREILRGTGRAQETVLPEVIASAAPPFPVTDAKAVLRRAVSQKTVRVAFVSSRVNDWIVRILRKIT